MHDDVKQAACCLALDQLPALCGRDIGHERPATRNKEDMAMSWQQQEQRRFGRVRVDMPTHKTPRCV